MTDFNLLAKPKRNSFLQGISDEKLQAILFLEEAGTDDLIGSEEEKALSTGRHGGIAIWPVSQMPLGGIVSQNCDSIFYRNSDEEALDYAVNKLIGLYDPWAILDTEDQWNVTGQRQVGTNSHSIRDDDFTYQFGSRLENVYSHSLKKQFMSPQQQAMLWRKWLATLKPGHFIEVFKGQVFKGYIPLVEPAIPIWSRKHDEAIDQLFAHMSQYKVQFGGHDD